MSLLDAAMQLKAKILAKKLKTNQQPQTEQPNPNPETVAAEDSGPFLKINRSNEQTPSPFATSKQPVPALAVPKETSVAEAKPPNSIQKKTDQPNEQIPPLTKRPKREKQSVTEQTKEASPAPPARTVPEDKSFSISINTNNVRVPEQSTDMKIIVAKPNPATATSKPQEDTAKSQPRKHSETTKPMPSGDIQVRRPVPQQPKDRTTTTIVPDNSTPAQQQVMEMQNSDTKVRVNKHYLRSMDKSGSEKAIVPDVQTVETEGRHRRKNQRTGLELLGKIISEVDAKKQQQTNQAPKPSSVASPDKKAAQIPTQKPKSHKTKPESEMRPPAISQKTEQSTSRIQEAPTHDAKPATTQVNQGKEHKLSREARKAMKLAASTKQEPQPPKPSDNGNQSVQGVPFFCLPLQPEAVVAETKEAEQPREKAVSLVPPVELQTVGEPEITAKSSGSIHINKQSSTLEAGEVPVKKVHKLQQKIVFKELEALQRALDNLEVSLAALESVAELKRDNKMPQQMAKKLGVLQQLLNL